MLSFLCCLPKGVLAVSAVTFKRGSFFRERRSVQKRTSKTNENGGFEGFEGFEGAFKKGDEFCIRRQGGLKHQHVALMFHRLWSWGSWWCARWQM